jgi:hypothetical protein
MSRGISFERLFYRYEPKTSKEPTKTKEPVSSGVVASTWRKLI